MNDITLETVKKHETGSVPCNISAAASEVGAFVMYSIRMFGDMLSGRFPASIKVISTFILGIGYFLLRNDLINDAIPIIGHLDDAVVSAICLIFLRPEVRVYRAWREHKERTPASEGKS